MNLIKIIFEVRKIIYRNEKDGYSIVNVKIKEHPKDIDIPTAEPIVVGNFNAIHLKDDFEAYGEWIDSGKNGYQFKVNTLRLLIPETNKGMVEFLVKNVNGVGKVIAKKIVEAFKEDTLDVIMNNPEKLLEVQGITSKKAEKIYASIKEHKGYEDVAVFLIPLGISHLDTVFIYDNLGYEAIEKIKDNPYILCLYDNININFKTIDNLAKQLGFKCNNIERIKHAILLYINNQMQNKGNMFIFKENIINNLNSFLINYGAYDINDIKEHEIKIAIKDLLTIKKIRIENNIEDKECVYLSYYNYIENEIVNNILTLINDASQPICTKETIDDFIRKYEIEVKIKLADKQKEAIYMFAKNRLSILGGGPGTGKTQTINGIIKFIKEIKPEATIELCAPTGRAAKRMTELTNMKAKTIHRLIGLNNFEQEKSNLIDIEADFLIIDEASMIDAYVFYSLLSVISPFTRILIVGDHEQLPSVGPGLILRDLIDSKMIPTTILDEIFRQAKNSQIVMNSHKVIKGLKTTDENGISFDTTKDDFYFLKTKSTKRINQLILESINRLIETGYNLDNIQVLSVMNKGDLGVAELNRMIQNKFNPKDKNKDEIEIGNNKYLRINDRVMQNVNNYDLGVFNGEVGKIVSININEIRNTDDLEIVVDFGDKTVSYDLENINELLLAYATTVHKSQGSEFDVVIMPFHSSLKILLHRNIIYTAWTRAKKRVICIGDIAELNQGIDRVDNTIRNSQIKNKIIDNFKKYRNVV